MNNGRRSGHYCQAKLRQNYTVSKKNCEFCNPNKLPVEVETSSLTRDNPDSDHANSVAEMEKQLSELCEKIYRTGERHILPIPPWVIVRILPKEQRTAGGIWLAEDNQNKPLYEGIVLETWRPYDTEYTYVEGGKKKTRMVHMECDVKVGQRIAFPHYEGQPVRYLDDKYYRMVRQSVDQNKNPYCGVMGILDYEGDKEVSQKIRDLMQQIAPITMSGVAVSRGNID